MDCVLRVKMLGHIIEQNVTAGLLAGSMVLIVVVVQLDVGHVLTKLVILVNQHSN